MHDYSFGKNTRWLLGSKGEIRLSYSSAQDRGDHQKVRAVDGKTQTLTAPWITYQTRTHEQTRGKYP